MFSEKKIVLKRLVLLCILYIWYCRNSKYMSQPEILHIIYSNRSNICLPAPSLYRNTAFDNRRDINPRHDGCTRFTYGRNRKTLYIHNNEPLAKRHYIIWHIRWSPKYNLTTGVVYTTLATRMYRIRIRYINYMHIQVKWVRERERASWPGKVYRHNKLGV